MARSKAGPVAMAGFVGLALVVGACGGGKGASTSAPEAATTTTVVDAATATTAAPDASTTASTAAVAPATTTTAKRTTATTARNNLIGTSKTGTNITKTPAGGIGNVTSETTAPSANAQPGGSITWLKSSEIVGLDPVNMLNSGANDGTMGNAVFDVLVYVDAGMVKPQTAESLTSTDALVWTLKIRPNIKFTDGTAYDAAAVKYNLLRMQDPKNKAVRASSANVIQQMDVIDPLTLKITLKAKSAVYPQDMTLTSFIGSPKALEELGDKFNSAPVGAGPYMLKSWVRDSQAVFVRNPGYWRAPLPYVDQITFKPVTDETQRLNSFCAKGANVVFLGAVSNANAAAQQKCGALQPQAINGGILLVMNLRKAPFNDPRLRQAIAMMYDSNEYAKTVTQGLIPPTRSMFRQDSPFFDSNILQPAYDPVKAQQLFDAVAADLGGPVTFTMTSFTSTNYYTAAQFFQGVLARYKNVKVDLVGKASAAHITDTTGGNFHLSVYGQAFDDPEPVFTNVWMCESSPNWAGWCSKEFDAHIAESRITLDPNKRVAAYKEAQKIFYSQLPAVYVEQRFAWYLTDTNLQDFTYVNGGSIMVDRMWIKSR